MQAGCLFHLLLQDPFLHSLYDLNFHILQPLPCLNECAFVFLNSSIPLQVCCFIFFFLLSSRNPSSALLYHYLHHSSATSSFASFRDHFSSFSIVFLLSSEMLTHRGSFLPSPCRGFHSLFI